MHAVCNHIIQTIVYYVLYMASRINFYSELAISLIRISDIANSELAISLIPN